MFTTFIILSINQPYRNMRVPEDSPKNKRQQRVCIVMPASQNLACVVVCLCACMPGSFLLGNKQRGQGTANAKGRRLCIPRRSSSPRYCPCATSSGPPRKQVSRAECSWPAESGCTICDASNTLLVDLSTSRLRSLLQSCMISRNTVTQRHCVMILYALPCSCYIEPPKG